MNGFIKATGGVLIALMLYLTLAKQSKDIAIIVTALSCIMIALMAMNYLQTIIDFFEKIQTVGKLNSEYMTILLRCIGIGILTEIVSHICMDGGNAALGKTLQLLASVIVLWLSLPMYTKLIDLVEEILVSIC